jgi:hypothetical protein
MPRLARASAVHRFDARIDAIRRAVPVEAYLSILHRAATTGFMPCLDECGNATGIQQEVSPDLRTRILQSLIDKVMPNAKVEESPPPPALAMPTDAELRGLSMVELIRTAAATAKQPAEPA